MKISAQGWIELITQAEPKRVWLSEELQAKIIKLQGGCYKVSNVERRARESDLVKSVSIPGKNYKGYQWAS